MSLDTQGESRTREPRPGRLAESTRVEAFSDGVLAIALTLLALDLRAPSRRSGFAHDLLHQWPSYLAYLASFVYIGVIWANHHGLFTRIDRVDRGLLWRNLLLLLPASILPFPTSTVASAFRTGTANDQLAALALYGLIAAAMAATWLAMFSYLARRPDLLADGVPAAYFGRERTRAFPGLLAPCIATALAVISPIAALTLFVLLAAFYAATSEGLQPSSRR